LRYRLREATAEAHRHLEAVMSLNERCQRRETYRALLARLFGIYAPLEAALTRMDWQGVDTLVHQRRKLPWLTADLRSLGLSSAEIEGLPKAGTLPDVHEPADAFGILYVLEGATLGGQIISRRLEATLNVTEDTGGRFFASYGSEVGVKWRAYVHAVADRIERAALSTFGSFDVWLAEGHSTAPSDGRGDHAG
jgi:heme oxygenase